MYKYINIYFTYNNIESIAGISEYFIVERVSDDVNDLSNAVKCVHRRTWRTFKQSELDIRSHTTLTSRPIIYWSATLPYPPTPCTNSHTAYFIVQATYSIILSTYTYSHTTYFIVQATYSIILSTYTNSHTTYFIVQATYSIIISTYYTNQSTYSIIHITICISHATYSTVSTLQPTVSISQTTKLSIKPILSSM